MKTHWLVNLSLSSDRRFAKDDYVMCLNIALATISIDLYYEVSR